MIKLRQLCAFENLKNLTKKYTLPDLYFHFLYNSVHSKFTEKF